MKRKLKDSRGETLVELLASILIGALSIALLFTAVTASGTMNRAAMAADKKFVQALNSAEEQTTRADGNFFAAGVDMKIIVKNNDTGATKNVEVYYYGEVGAVSYKLP